MEGEKPTQIFKMVGKYRFNETRRNCTMVLTQLHHDRRTHGYLKGSRAQHSRPLVLSHIGCRDSLPHLLLTLSGSIGRQHLGRRLSCKPPGSPVYI
jgi:hypothetical protein